MLNGQMWHVGCGFKLSLPICCLFDLAFSKILSFLFSSPSGPSWFDEFFFNHNKSRNLSIKVAFGFRTGSIQVHLLPCPNANALPTFHVFHADFKTTCKSAAILPIFQVILVLTVLKFIISSNQGQLINIGYGKSFKVCPSSCWVQEEGLLCLLWQMWC